ncbi:polysaccharide pyruvyl transferase family protein [Arthrobacter echini]|nr:polysaccharide pyruvyl transferase family protein [Arthrobacter echini]
MRPGPIYLIGPSGNPNYGDEFIAAAWLRHLARVRPDDDVWLDCPQPGHAQILFRDAHPRARFTNTVWRLVHDHQHLPAEEAAAGITERVTGLGTPTYDLGLLTMRDAGTLHLIGGGYINATWRHHAGLVHAMKATQALSGARLLATGQGLLPAVTGPVAAKDLFHGFDHVTARDQGGAEAYGVDFGLDDAFLGASEVIPTADDAGTSHAIPSAGTASGTADAEARSEPDGRSDGLFICIQSDTVDRSRIAPAIAIARREAIRATEQGREVFYLEAIPGADRAAYDQLADLIPETNFLPFATLWTEGLPLSPRQCWVTSRFHFHLLGAAAGGAGIAIAMNPGYYDVKHESIIALGSGWALASDDDAPTMPVSAGPLNAGLADLVAGKRAEAFELYPEAPATEETPRPRSLTSQVGDALRRRRFR